MEPPSPEEGLDEALGGSLAQFGLANWRTKSRIFSSGHATLRAETRTGLG